ncbi:transposase [Mycobacterium sp. Y57]|nr:transposase [Mycolicibacterium xanthum]
MPPSNEGRRGDPFGDDRRVVEGIVYRYRTGVPLRDLPRSEFGPWQTVRKRHRSYAADDTWDGVLMALLTMADAQGQLDWTLSVDATINRADQHATNTTRPDRDTGGQGIQTSDQARAAMRASHEAISRAHARRSTRTRRPTTA